jgi:hypothetical protein
MLSSCVVGLAAQVPWEECEHPYQLVHQVVEQGRRPPLPTTCEPALAVLPSVCELIQQCWHTDPEQRPAFAAVVERLHVLSAAVAKEVRALHVLSSPLLSSSPLFGGTETSFAIHFTRLALLRGVLGSADMLSRPVGYARLVPAVLCDATSCTAASLSLC